jgi:hypothetical protein
MSLKTFHLFFIAVSVALAAFLAAWAMGQYRAAPESGYVLLALASVAVGIALGFYGAAFQRKAKRL